MADHSFYYRRRWYCTASPTARSARSLSGKVLGFICHRGSATSDQLASAFPNPTLFTHVVRPLLTLGLIKQAPLDDLFGDTSA